MQMSVRFVCLKFLALVVWSENDKYLLLVVKWASFYVYGFVSRRISHSAIILKQLLNNRHQ